MLTSSTRFGQINLQGDGTFTYTPEAGFSGTDRFAYRTAPWTTPTFVEINVLSDAVWTTDDNFDVSHGSFLAESVALTT